MNHTKHTVGITIGKFAPLHLGHVDMMKFALSVVDRLFVIVYDAPDKTKVPLETRAKWIRDIFKSENVIVIEGYNAPNRHEDTQEVRELQEAYIGSIARSIRPTHFISSESYGDHLSRYLGVENVLYDPARVKRKISSTMIRNDIDRYEDFIPGHIKNDLSVDFTNISEERHDNE